MISVLRSAFGLKVLGQNVVSVIAYGFTFNRLRKRRTHDKNHSLMWRGVKVLQRLFRQRSNSFQNTPALVPHTCLCGYLGSSVAMPSGPRRAFSTVSKVFHACSGSNISGACNADQKHDNPRLNLYYRRMIAADKPSA